MYYPKDIEKKYCKECGCLLGYRNKTGYCPSHYGIYNKKVGLWKSLTKYQEENGVWNTGVPVSDEIKAKIAKTLKKTSYFVTCKLYKKGTKYEDMFQEMYPSYEREIVFSTKITGGIEKWGTWQWRADFYDSKNKIVYEIDGSSHTLPGRRERDKRKDDFMKSIGIKVIRYTNKETEKMYKEFAAGGK